MEEMSFGVLFAAMLSMMDQLMPMIVLFSGVLLGSILISYILSAHRYQAQKQKHVDEPFDQEIAKAWAIFENLHLANRYAERVHHHRARISKRVSNHRY